MLFLLGKEDDLISAEGCTGTIARLRARGANVVDTVLYPNALHSFDVDRAKMLYMPNAQGFKGCTSAGQDLDNLTYYVGDNQVTSKEFGDYWGKCTVRGGSIGPNHPAKSDSRDRTKAFVLKTFAM